MNKFLKRKGGFSLMEAVVAMAIVVLVTASALTITMYSTAAKVKATEKNKAINCAYNIVECFKVSTNTETFRKNFAFAEEIDLKLQPDQTNPDKSSVSLYYNSFVITVNVENSFSTLNVTVTDKDNKEIANLSYTKYPLSTESNGGAGS